MPLALSLAALLVATGPAAPDASGSLEKREREEARVLEQIARALLERDLSGQVVAATSVAFESGGRATPDLRQCGLHVRAETLRDFSKRAHARSALPKALLAQAGFDVVSDSEWKALFQRKGVARPWREFARKYPRSSGLLRFSRAGFDSAFTQALVYVVWGADEVMGSGDLYLLERTDEEWSVDCVEHLWIARAPVPADGRGPPAAPAGAGSPPGRRGTPARAR
jgi:hypothetical protein